MRIALEKGLWETDFLLNELLPKGEVVYDINLRSDILVFISRVHSYRQILNIVEKTKPKIIICLSDELISENLNDFNQLGNYCDLFLRQYHHPQYTYTPNTIHIPLGYTNGCKIFKEEKKLNWSFFGEIKSDRVEMLNEFSRIEKNFVGKSAPKDLMCKVYSKSFFVPCGRGNSSLDCFRLYEASMNGAIPVVVGSKKEINLTFKYEENPPWIFAETWNEAVRRCMSFTENKLKEYDAVSWWKNRISKIRTKIEEVL